EPELLDHVDETAVTHPVAGGKRIDVADELVRLSNVATNDRYQRAVHGAADGELHDRKVKPLFIDRVGVRPKAAPANIHDVRRAGEEADEASVVEGGRHHRYVVEMARALPRVVGDVDIAFEQVLAADATDEVRHCVGHRVDVPGSAGDGLRQHLALVVIDAGGEVARLAYRGGEGGAHQCLRLFLDDG